MGQKRLGTIDASVLVGLTFCGHEFLPFSLLFLFPAPMTQHIRHIVGILHNSSEDITYCSARPHHARLYVYDHRYKLNWLTVVVTCSDRQAHGLYHTTCKDTFTNCAIVRFTNGLPVDEIKLIYCRRIIRNIGIMSSFVKEQEI